MIFVNLDSDDLELFDGLEGITGIKVDSLKIIEKEKERIKRGKNYWRSANSEKVVGRLRN